MFRYYFACNIFSYINNYPPPFQFRPNLYGVEKLFMENWLTGKEASSFTSFIIKIQKISCPITLSSSNFETREFKAAIITFFYIVYSDFFEFCDALCI